MRQPLPLLAAGIISLLSPLSSFALDYYVDAVNGNDTNNGTSEATPWRNLAKVNAKTNYAAGDTINFRGGQTFAGSLTVTSSGTAASPIIYRTYGGSEKATIEVSATTANGVTISGKSNVRLQDIYVKGPWLYTQTGSTTPIGIHITGTCNNVHIDRVRVSNFQGFGIRFETTSQTSTGFRLRNSEVHDTGHDGVRVAGRWKQINHRDVYVAHTKAYRCKGFDSQDSSGSGIQLSQVDGGLIEYCEAHTTGSGWGGKGGGPIGIWSWDSKAVIIQYSYAHKNSNGAGSYDGGGFDIDGGDTNCIIQYCYSHNNDGAGYFIAHFPDSTPTNNNVIRYNISQNDARATPQGALNLWGPSTDNYIYNNVIYGDKVIFKRESSGAGQKIFNNIFFASGTNYVANSGVTTDIAYQNNCYWAANGAPRFRWGSTDHVGLSAWRTASGMERDAQSRPTGFNVNPQLVNPGGAPTTGVDVTKLHEILAYKLKDNSPLINQATDLRALWGEGHPGLTDYHRNTLPQHGANDVGAHEFSDPLPPAPAPATNLRVTGTSASTITLAWDDSSTTEAGFRIQQSGNGVDWQMFELASANVTSFTCAGLTPSTAYHFRVVAFNANGEATPTNSVQSTTNPPPQSPNPVSGAATATTVATVTWTDTNQFETGYQVDRSTNGGSSYSLRGTTVADTTSFADYGLTPGSTYHYRVRAVDGPLNGPYSSIVAVTTPAALDSVIVDNADATGVTITGTWSTTTNSAAYGGNFLHDNNTNKGLRKVLFTARLPSPGIYEAHARWVSDTNRSASVPLTIAHRDGSTLVRVDQRSNGLLWYYLGRFTYEAGTPATILIDNTDTTGQVVADAIQFIKVADLPPAAPNAPAGLGATVLGPTTARLRWTDTNGGQAASEIFHRLGNGAWVLAASAPAGETEASLGGLEPGGIYQARVDAVRDGLRADSVVITFTTPTRLQDWKLRHLGDPDAPDHDDADYDGISNLLEYGLGGNPRTADTSILPQLETAPGNTLALIFSRPEPAEISYEVLASSSLMNWQVVASRPVGASGWTGSFNASETGSGDARRVRVEDPLTLEQTSWRFLRLRVTRPE